MTRGRGNSSVQTRRVMRMGRGSSERVSGGRMIEKTTTWPGAANLTRRHGTAVRRCLASGWMAAANAAPVAAMHNSDPDTTRKKEEEPWWGNRGGNKHQRPPAACRAPLVGFGKSHVVCSGAAVRARYALLLWCTSTNKRGDAREEKEEG